MLLLRRLLRRWLRLLRLLRLLSPTRRGRLRPSLPLLSFPMPDPLRVLVLCTGNSCRSQMLEGWLRRLGGDRLHVRSAGVETHGVNPRAARVMAEAGVDLSGHTSDHVDAYRGEPFDVVVTVCDSARERCPYFPADAERIHHAFPDPAQATGPEDAVLAEFRAVRDAIRAWAEAFVTERAGPPGAERAATGRA